MKSILNEAMPALIPEYPIEIAGHHLTLRFDVNINKTKKGVKLQFVMKDLPSDSREVQTITNEIGIMLQEKFGSSNMQIVQDLENPYNNVIGFLIPLPSIATFIIGKVLKGDNSSKEPEVAPEKELPTQELPATVQPAEEPVRERLMRIAGLK